MPSLHDIVTKGSTDRSVVVHIMDSGDGTPETGVVFNTSGIDLWYRREGAAKTSITEATLAALTTAHTDGGFLHISDGDYRLDLPDAAFATAANYVDFGGTVTGMIVVGGRVRLVDYSLEDSVRMGLTALPNAAAAASGGLLINGSNTGTVTLAALTVTGVTTHTGATVHTGNVSMAAGLNITQSSSNTPALVVTGNGTGNGATITSGSGATGTGLAVVAASTNGAAATFAGVGTGNGITATGGATGHGISGVGGATSGNGIRAAGTAGNSVALNLVGQGSAAGLLATGGATGHGISAVGGATSGNGINAAAATSGVGVNATGVGTSQAGIVATGGSTSSNGITATGGGTGHGISATSGAGATGNGLTLLAASTNGHGLKSTGTGTGDGAELTAGASGSDLDADIAGTLTTVTTATTTTNLTNLPTIPANWLTAAGTAADFTTEIQSGLATAAELAKVPKSDGTSSWNATALAAIQSEANDALVAYDPPTKAELDTAVANVSVDEIQPSALADLFNTDSGTTYGSAVAGSVVAEIADNAGGSALTEAGIADAVWDEILSGHAGVGSTGAALAAAGGSGDPWATALPGAYGSGTAGKIIGDNINATISSRATQTSVDTIDDLLDTEVGALTTELAKVPKSDGTATWNATALASLQQEATDALNAYDPPTRAEATTDANSILAKLPAALVGGRIAANTEAVAGIVVQTNGSGTQEIGGP